MKKKLSLVLQTFSCFAAFAGCSAAARQQRLSLPSASAPAESQPLRPVS